VTLSAVEYSSKGRFVRKCLTTSVALLALLLSVLTTFMARDFKSKVLMNARLPCPGDSGKLIKVAYEVLFMIAPALRVNANSKQYFPGLDVVRCDLI